MSKDRKGRGVIAIALFQIAGALERWAKAQESIAATNHRIAMTQEAHLNLAQADFDLRQGVKNEIADLPAKVGELRELLVRAIESGELVLRTEPPFAYDQRAAEAHYTQGSRAALFLRGDNGEPLPYVTVARKRSRILALEAQMPFTVETDRGVMRGEAGDWLVTNHPDDDPGSDLWTISRERFENTYEVLRADA